MVVLAVSIQTEKYSLASCEFIDQGIIQLYWRNLAMLLILSTNQAAINGAESSLVILDRSGGAQPLH